MNIAIVSYHYTPEITPRAFRASSIFNSLTAKGHNVELIIPDKVSGQHSGSNDDIKQRSSSKIKPFLRKAAEKLLPGGKDLKYFNFFIQGLKSKEFDLVISVGLPFSVHLAVAVARRFYGLTAKSVIFDYGDPYSANPNGNFCFYAEAIEKWALKQCDFVLTPIQEAVKLFENIIPKNCKVAVIPQGYKIHGVEISDYSINNVPTFCYAGILYKGLREPDSFLKYISELKSDFRFIVYTDQDNPEVMSILTKYSNTMKERLVIRAMIPREKCLFQQSEMDFLVNFANEGGVQQPSKLIDYSLSKRPYLSIQNNQSDFEQFDNYLNGDYGNFQGIDVNEFDQNLIADKIINLVKKEI
jgi:hypothetical protein